MVVKQKRKTKHEVDELVMEIHRMQVLGASNDMIMRELKITERNFYDTYLPRLNKKWKEIWEKKTLDDLYRHSQEFGERLNSAYTNARTKAREDKANPGWGQLEQELGMLLFQYNRESPVVSAKLRQLEQKASRIDEHESGREVHEPIILQDSAPQRSQDDGSDTTGTEERTE